MGLYIKKSTKGIRIFHSASNEPIHDGFLKNDDAVKRVLIQNEIRKFHQEVIKIDKDFLEGFNVNGRPFRSKDENGLYELKGWAFILKTYREKNPTKIFKTEAEKILKRLRLK